MKATMVLLIALGLAACVTDGPRDMSGKLSAYSEFRRIASEDAAVNVPLFIKPRFLGPIQATTRDGVVTHNVFGLRGDGGWGGVSVQTVSGGDRFTRGPEIRELAGFREWLAQKGYSLEGEATPVRHKNQIVGYRAVAKTTHYVCVLARAAYELSGPVFDYGGIAFDTSVVAHFCTPAGMPVDATMFDKMLSELDLVKDRAVFRAALTGR